MSILKTLNIQCKLKSKFFLSEKKLQPKAIKVTVSDRTK